MELRPRTVNSYRLFSKLKHEDGPAVDRNSGYFRASAPVPAGRSVQSKHRRFISPFPSISGKLSATYIRLVRYIATGTGQKLDFITEPSQTLRISITSRVGDGGTLFCFCRPPERQPQMKDLSILSHAAKEMVVTVQLGADG